MPTTSFTLSDELLDKIRDRAEQENKQQSEIIRNAIEYYLSEDRPEIENHETRIKELEEEISIIKSALISEAASSYDYKAGDLLNENDREG